MDLLAAKISGNRVSTGLGTDQLDYRAIQRMKFGISLGLFFPAARGRHKQEWIGLEISG